MIYLTQLIYIRPGREAEFLRFEDIVLPLLQKYHGTLLLRCRPEEAQFVETTLGRPYEIHLVRFESGEDFESYARDPERQAVLYLKEQSIEKAVLIQGKLI